MGQRKRHDGPGVWHHVANRGIARRPVFERPTDARYFLSRIARAYRRGLLEVYAYCLMVTHFHLLLRSPAGRLSDAMKLVQNPFVRWFNRGRKRDGPLFRGRFLSRPVKSETDWWTVFRYIHLNPVKAGIVETPEEYPHSSAKHLAHPGPHPRWLLRTGGLPTREPGLQGTEQLQQSLRTPLSEAEQAFVERRLRSTSNGEDPLDTLIAGAPSLVRAWMKRKSELADGTQPDLPIATPGAVLAAVTAAESARSDLTLKPGRTTVPLWPILQSGLLRQACGLTYTEISIRLRCSVASAHKWHREHRRQLGTDAEYADRAAAILSQVLQRSHRPASQLLQGCSE